MTRLCLALLLVLHSILIPAFAQSSRVAPFSTSVEGAVPSTWAIITLPKLPRHTRYAIVTLDGVRVLKAESDASYANLVHPLKTGLDPAPILRWRWRVDQVPAHSDLTVKNGDDLAARVCVLFDLPLDRLGFTDRIKIMLGRFLFKLELPPATICYVWDRTLAAGTWLPNAYTNRVRMLVLRSAANGELGRWFDERRDLRVDFALAFPRESKGGAPAISAIVVASDTDNTGDSALAYFGDISLERD
jgi:hypothetical protein